MNNFKQRFLEQNKNQHLVSSPYTDWLEKETALIVSKLKTEALLHQAQLAGLQDLNKEMLSALESVDAYFVNLQNSCALSASDESVWKLVSKILNT